MRKISNYFFALTLLILFTACDNNDVRIDRSEPPGSIDLARSFYYEVDLTHRSDDKFKVSFFMSNLDGASDIFQLPATVPGTYSILDFGRFVTDLKAYDKDYNPMNTTLISVDQWQIEDPENLYRIDYQLLETWDTPVEEHKIFPMAGTSIEDNHVLLNTFGVLGYLSGQKDRDFYLNLIYPDGWEIGTSLEKTQEGWYWADNYDDLADSPILLGELTSNQLTVENTDIGVYTYSEQGVIASSDLIGDLTGVVEDASSFLKGLPVDAYNFLYLFEGTRSYGALEHSFSSVYVMAEILYLDYGDVLKGIAAHEFFHVVVPLNIHSEIIEDFNYADPTPSEHLWLYEGVTEWASDLMQYRNGSMSLNELFAEFSKKINNDTKYFDPNFSLSQIGIQSYTQEGGSQFGNIYNRGAMTAALLDIRLLELSDGTYGLRELILDLMQLYGKDKSFPESGFFDILVDMTYPEIDGFITSYIKNAEPLPYQEFFGKLGIDYDPVSNEFSTSGQPDPVQQLLFDKWSTNF